MTTQSEQPAFRQLQNFIQRETARKPRRTGPKLETANQLTQQIIKRLREDGHFAARINVGGIYDERLGKYQTSGSTLGVSDIVACVNGMFIGIEIKAGADAQSAVQKRVEDQIKAANGYYVIVRNRADFERFYSELTAPPF